MAELAHRRLADFHWQSGVWPAGLPETAALCRAPVAEWASLLKELRRLGWTRRGRRLFHAQVAAVRAEAAQALREARRVSRKAARARWDAPMQPQCASDAPASAPAMREQCASNARAMREQCH
jgi:hypothetical protein